jgi:hypothetical protein
VASISAEPISATGPIYYDPYDVEIDRDPHPIWQRMREEQPIWWNERYQFWALSRLGRLGGVPRHGDLQFVARRDAGNA